MFNEISRHKIIFFQRVHFRFYYNSQSDISNRSELEFKAFTSVIKIIMNNLILIFYRYNLKNISIGLQFKIEYFKLR